MDLREIADLDVGVHRGWTRTGAGFNVLKSRLAGSHPVCRFYIPPERGNSHFFSASEDECGAIAARLACDANFAGPVLETPEECDILRPDAVTGACPAGTQAVYRMWNGRVDSNHRYTADMQIRPKLLVAGYIAEGYGPDGAAMCAPQ